jgi:putative chitinase
VNRKALFNHIRGALFHGNLAQQQVDGVNTIVDGFEKRYPKGDSRWLAYILATVYWETARTIQPIREIGHGAGHPYGVPDPQTGQTYYGRGYVQLTWKANYQKFGSYLVSNPDLALKPEVAALVMFSGMERGIFTGKKLSDFFNDHKADWVNARTIINGHDHASDIAGIAQSFYAAIQAAQQGEGKMTDTSGVVTQPTPAASSSENVLADWIIKNEVPAETALRAIAVAKGVPGFAIDMVFQLVNPIINQAIQNLHPEDIAKLILPHLLGGIQSLVSHVADKQKGIG